MKIRRAVVFVKETALTLIKRNESSGTVRMRKLLKGRDESVKRIRPAHDEHKESVIAVRKALRERGIKFVERKRVPKRPLKGFDLVVSVGGDGMLLNVSHAVRNSTLVLGVNSSPTFSVGYLTGCIGATFGETVDKVIAGRLKPLLVQRLQVKIGRKVLEEPVLNDVLFCANNPAVMTRYKLSWPDGAEMQRSSGVWVATPAGSSSALRSAGGPVLPLVAQQFAFLVREPYAPPGAGVRVPVAVLQRGQQLKDRMPNLGGKHLPRRFPQIFPVPFGGQVAFSLHPKPLHLVRRPRSAEY